MTFAENFKKTLTTTDIFKKPLEKEEEGNNKSQIAIQPAIPSITPERLKFKFNDLVSETVKKIKNTPYWNEYSDQEQEKMLSKYFDVKIKKGKYSQIKFNLKDKLTFIEDVFNRIK